MRVDICTLMRDTMRPPTRTGTNMETLYIKLTVKKSDTCTEEIRDAGLLFENIADAAGLDRDAVDEIDESNYLAEISNIKRKYEQS